MSTFLQRGLKRLAFKGWVPPVLLASIFLVGAGFTRITTNQLAPAIPTSAPAILVYDPATAPGFNLATFDSSILLDKTTTPWTLRAAPVAAQAAPPVTAGPGITVTGSQVGVDTALLLSSLTFNDSWAFGTVANAACSAMRSFPATGANTGDRLATAIVSPALPAGVFVTANVTGPGMISYQTCNLSGKAVVLASNNYVFSTFTSF